MSKILLLLFIIPVFCFGQSRLINGKITDSSTGEGVAFASIEESRFQEIYTSDEEGNFSIEIPSFPITLIVSSDGYLEHRQKLTGPVVNLEIELLPTSEALSEVLVKGSIIPRRVLETPASVGILSTGELERNDQTNLVGALNYLPGIYVHQGALNTNKISIRGVGSRSQYSTNRIKAYFEGIPISTAEGATTLDDIDMSAIERVEVIKGPNSSLYGAGLGGVLNLYAKSGGRKGTNAKAETIFGSFGLLKKSLILSHKAENSQWFAAYNDLSTDSFRDNGNYDRTSLTLHGKLASGENNSLSLLANFTQLFAYIPSSISLEQMQEDPSAAAFTWGASEGYESYDKGMLGLSYRHQLLYSLENTTSIHINFRDAFEPRPFDILKEEQVATGIRTKFNWEAEAFGLASEFSIGAEYQQEWYDTGTLANLYEDFPGEGSVVGKPLSNNSQLRSYYNLFGQWNLPVSEKLNLEAGINFNGTNYDLTDLYSEDSIDQSGTYRFDPVISPRIGAVYELTPEKALYANVSHGFSTPTVAETLTPEGMINTNLKPETGMNYELGFKGNWFRNSLYTEVAFYSIQIKNLLVAERIAEDQYVGKNVGKTNHNGVEIFLTSTLNLGRGLTAKPFLNAALNFFEFDRFVERGENYSGNSLPGVPKHTINGGVSLLSDWGFSLHTSLFHAGEIPLNDANIGFSDPYYLLNLKADYTVSLFPYLDLGFSAGVNNLLEEKYASSILPNAVGFGGAAPRYYYPGPPRNLFGSISLSLNL